MIWDDGIKSKPGVLRLTLTSGPTQPIIRTGTLARRPQCMQSCSGKENCCQDEGSEAVPNLGLVRDGCALCAYAASAVQGEGMLTRWVGIRNMWTRW